MKNKTTKATLKKLMKQIKKYGYFVEIVPNKKKLSTKSFMEKAKTKGVIIL